MNGDQSRTILLEDVDVLESIQDNVKHVGNRRTINLRNDLAVMQWRSFVKRQQSLDVEHEEPIVESLR
jgi:hypothetical protein